MEDSEDKKTSTTPKLDALRKKHPHLSMSEIEAALTLTEKKYPNEPKEIPEKDADLC